LSDPEKKYEVRSEAARALGVMAIPASVRKYNYPLIAHSVGMLAADLGTQIDSLIPKRETASATSKAAPAPDSAKPAAKSPPNGKAAGKTAGKVAGEAPATPATRRANANPVKAQYLTALLIGPVYQAFEGVPGPRGDAGGLKRNAGGEAAEYSQQVFEL